MCAIAHSLPPLLLKYLFFQFASCFLVLLLAPMPAGPGGASGGNEGDSDEDDGDGSDNSDAMSSSIVAENVSVLLTKMRRAKHAKTKGSIAHSPECGGMGMGSLPVCQGKDGGEGGCVSVTDEQ
jgi:hypothetical protein